MLSIILSMKRPQSLAVITNKRVVESLYITRRQYCRRVFVCSGLICKRCFLFSVTTAQANVERYTLRSKSELIDNLIKENLLHISHDEDITQTFETYVEQEKRKAVAMLCAEEKLDETKVAALLDNYLFTDVAPCEDEIARAIAWTPSLLERKMVLKRVYEKVCGVIDTFINGMRGF